jgi:hypothetical protein
VTLSRPVELVLTCTGGAAVSLRTTPAVTGVTGPCDQDPAFRSMEILELPTYPQRIVFQVRSPDSARWRLGLDSALVPTIE